MKSHMPKVITCRVESCTFNHKGACHAPGININGPMPDCTTFYAADRKVGEDTDIGGVGACKAMSCTFNKALRCIAMGIQVDKAGSRALCRTFEFDKAGIMVTEVHKSPSREIILQ